MIETTTKVPETVDALKARFEDLFADSGVRVIDGPPSDEDLPDDVLVIGHPGADGVAIANELTREQGMGNRYAEVFTITCVFSSVSGDKDMKARRDRCLWAVRLINQGLKADRGLGGVVDRVGLGAGMDWGQDQHRDGATCDVRFSVVGKALL